MRGRGRRRRRVAFERIEAVGRSWPGTTITTTSMGSARSDSFGGGNEPGSRPPPHPHAYILFSLFIYSDCRWSRQSTLRIPMAASGPRWHNRRARWPPRPFGLSPTSFKLPLGVHGIVSLSISLTFLLRTSLRKIPTILRERYS